MFNDYITLMLLNMVAGLLTLALFMRWGIISLNTKPWAAAFAVVGLVAIVMGVHMTSQWPAPAKLKWANPAFGEMTVMFGVLYLGAAWALAREWSLLPLSTVAFVAGGMAVVLGARIGELGLSQSPPITAAGFILTGLGGVLLAPALVMRRYAAVRAAYSAMMFAAAAIWGLVATLGYWAHLEMLSK